jgi:hypothetical protein
MDTPEQHYFKEFASEIFPDWGTDPDVYEAARAAWKRVSNLESKAAIIARWEDECG